MARPKIMTKGKPVDPFDKSSIADTVEKLKALEVKHRAAQDAETSEDAAEKLRRAKKMDPSATRLTDEYFPEMIDPALAITGAIAGGVVAGNLLDRLRMALKSHKTRKAEIKRAQQAAEKPVKMPPMRFGPKK